MLARAYPNSEIEVLLFGPRRLSTKDPKTPGPRLDIDSPVRTDLRPRLKSRAVTGFGRAHRGKCKFRSGTKRRVQRLGGAIDSLAESSGLIRCFVTLTCPGSSRAAVAGFSAWTGYLQDTLQGWLRKKQERATGQRGFFRLHVWELQRRGAEHLHLVCLLSRKVFLSVKEEIRQWYYEVLSRICSLGQVDIFEREGSKGTWLGRPDVLQLKVEEVTNSVSAYLSKYLSKSLAARKGGFGFPSTPRPARLWGASRALKAALSEITTSEFWSSTLAMDAESSRLVQELASCLGLKFSVATWRQGIMTRIRLFFCGDKSLEQEVWAFLVKLFSALTEENPTPTREVPAVSLLFKKALRIQSENKKRVAFNDLYGTEISRALASWASQSTVDRYPLQILVTCLQSFDEITLKDLRGIKPLSGGKKKTIGQLEIELFPPRQ